DLMLVFGIWVLLRQARPYVQFSVRALFGAPLLALGAGLGLGLQVWMSLPLSWGSITQKTLGFIGGYTLILLLLEPRQISYWLREGKRLLLEKTAP
ncbi:MAG: hypothetical protein D6755_12715, partial [Anaerolineae bacterium]